MTAQGPDGHPSAGQSPAPGSEQAVLARAAALLARAAQGALITSGDDPQVYSTFATTMETAVFAVYRATDSGLDLHELLAAPEVSAAGEQPLRLIFEEDDHGKWLYVLREQALRELLERARQDLPMELPRQPSVPQAFPDGTGKVPNNPLVAAGLSAIWKGGKRARSLIGGWLENEAGRPVYQHAGGRGGQIVIYPSPRGALDPLPTTEKLWSFVESLNPFTADVALAVLAQLCEPTSGDRPKFPLLESVTITADAILRYKGIQRWGMERRLMQERVFDEMERLRALSFDVEKWPVWNAATGKWDGRGASWQGDQLFNIVKVETYQQSLFGEREQIAVSWVVRTGQWARYWLNAQGRVWIGRMARVLLELDHRETRGAAVMGKKLGQRLTMLGGAVRADAPLDLRIDHLLRDIGELPAEDARDKDWAGRTRDRFEDALQTLQEVGVLASVVWPEGYGLGDDRRRGWVNGWLAAKIRVTLPEAPPELLPSTPLALPAPRRRRPDRKPPSAAQRIDGTTIRRLRAERCWSQEMLATRLNISTTYLSLIENGKRIPSKALAARLSAWIAEL